MKILHTADWHIGKKLYGRQRFAEHGEFLRWLLGALVREEIDGLIVAGDIFDTSNPSEQSRRLYTEFLAEAQQHCDWIVVTGGNHDSPSVLDGSKELLAHLNVHVLGKKCENREDELIEVKNGSGEVSAYVAAVPYLRDRDLRQSEAGETEQVKEKKLRDGIKAHYDELADIIEARRKDDSIPAIAVGHLYAAGCSAENEGDGVRDLYVGGLGHVSAETFSPVYDYVALGHIHVPQIVGKKESIRYCGSPIPMGYGEAGQQKQVVVIEFSEAKSKAMNIEILKVPCFQSLKRVKGDIAEIKVMMTELVKSRSNAWVEVVYTGETFQGDLKSEVEAMVEGSELEVLRIENRTMRRRSMRKVDSEETLNQLSVGDVFERCLVDHEVSDAERAPLQAAYREITNQVEAELLG